MHIHHGLHHCTQKFKPCPKSGKPFLSRERVVYCCKIHYFRMSEASLELLNRKTKGVVLLREEREKER